MVGLTIPYLLERAAFKHPHREAIVSERGRWSYSQWERNTNRCAHALARQGIRKGDHVATIFLNGNEVLETYAALMKLGAVVVPLNARLSPEELVYIVEHSDASAILLSSEFEEPVRKIRERVDALRHCLISGGGAPADMVDFDKLAQEQPENAPNVEISEADTACILYTAGTTGRPKGVLLSHRNLIWAAVNVACDVDLQPEYRVLMVFPLYHAAAFQIFVSNLYMGCTHVMMRSFDPRRVMELVEEEKINRMTFPPTVWNFILQVPDVENYDTSSVRSLSAGAEPVPMELKRRLLALFPNAGLGETYGMTESAATIATLKPRHVLEKMASVGKPFVNVEVFLADETGAAAACGETGEILARGPNVMKGYYKDPDETERTLKGGWLHTGDLGRLDSEGFLYIVGRKKDMIISGGENIFPIEIEEVLYAHPKILEAAVIGVPDPDWGERVHAVISPKKGEHMSEAEVIDFCRDRIAGFKRPRSVEFVESLPKSPVGKILKRVLREKWGRPGPRQESKDF
jgi:acyl-CoA synthetase (AMP-forming)/AMP-acid ligase II